VIYDQSNNVKTWRGCFLKRMKYDYTQILTICCCIHV